MKRFVYLIIGIVVILFVFEDEVKPYVDPVVEKAILVWESYLARPFGSAKDFILNKSKEWQEKEQANEPREKVEEEVKE
ncbi:MAG TPA: hypothetical protein VJ103_02190 [Candidatus Paceibacterota bacterium]|nr:hypothetical protein [Candidatus Paceibacterota bacterium]